MKFAIRVTDIRNAFQRLSHRTSRELANIAMVGRSAGAGKLAAAEVPFPEYIVPEAYKGSENPLLQLWSQASHPQNNIPTQMLDRVATLSWLALGQTIWFQGERVVAKDGKSVKTGLLGFPRLCDDINQKEDFINHFRLPRELPNFDKFIRERVKEFKKNWGRDTNISEKDFLGRIAAQEECVDRYVIGVFEALELVATELSRRPTVTSSKTFNLFDVYLWRKYSNFLGAVDCLFKNGDAASANKVTEEYGSFLKVVMIASGRREVQGVKWIMEREFSRWKLIIEKRTNEISTEIGDILKQYPVTETASSLSLENTSDLYKVCMEPCREKKCHANWDASLLMTGKSNEAFDRICRVILLACNHIKGADKFDRVAGMAAGGVNTAAVIALSLRKPLSILVLDNLLNMVPQAAIAERLLLVDDAYQTGYSYQLLRSQLIGLKPVPPAKNLFVLFKAKSRCDNIDVESFRLTTAMNYSREVVGCALEYEYACNAGNRKDVGQFSYYPIPIKDHTVGVADGAASKVAEILKERLASAKLRASENLNMETFGSKIRPIISRSEFIKTELLFDYPDLVLEIGWMIYQRMKDEPILAYIAGSVKMIPYLTAATLYAAFEGNKHIPVIITPNKGELPYHEMLDKLAEETAKTTLDFMGYSKNGGSWWSWVDSCSGAAGGPEVVNPASQKHDGVLKARLGVAVNVRDDMTAFDSGKGMFNSYAQARDGAVDRFPNGIQGFSLGFFARHQHVGSVRGVTRKSGVHQQCAALGPAPTGLIGQLFVMHTAGNRPAQSLDLAPAAHDQILEAMPLLFPAVMALLPIFVLGPAHRTLHSIQHKFQARALCQHPLQIRRSARRQFHPPPQGFFQNRREPMHPPVGFRLVKTKQKPHDLLQRVKLEIHQDEQQLVSEAPQLPLASGAQGANSSRAPLGRAAPPRSEPLLFKRKHQLLEFAPIQRGRRAQQPRVGPHFFNVHAAFLPKNNPKHNNP